MLIGPHKVDTMFGYPGGAILPVFDELYRTPAKFILNRHEQASGHCADGYYRATGKPGVCIVTSGPGATNTITPLATAQMDSIPILVFSGQVATKVIGNDAFQEADVTGISRPCTKWNYLVKDVRELPRVINEAFAIATSGRPGPVLVDLPKDVTTGICPEEVDDTPRPHVLAKRRQANTHPGHDAQAQAAAELINKSEKPVLYVGGGAIISGAWKEIRKLADKANIPCTTTLLGLGAFDEHGPQEPVHARHARQRLRQLRGAGVRLPDRRRRPLRRPRDRQPGHLRPARQDHPRGHRPQQHQQERGRGRGRHRRRQGRRRADRQVRRAPRPPRVVQPDRRLEEALPVQVFRRQRPRPSRST